MTKFDTINWQEVELALSSIDKECVPTSARDMVAFADQYEHAVNWLLNYKKNDFSNDKMSAEFLMRKRDKLMFREHGYKKSILECWIDLSVSEHARVPIDWNIVLIFSRFFSSDISLNNDGDSDGIKKFPPLPAYVLKNFSCRNNKKLKSLVGGPKWVGNDYSCDFCGLTSLDGGPDYVGNVFDCDNNKLTSLIGGPDYVGSAYWCYKNKLVGFDGLPTRNDNCIFNYWGNPIDQNAQAIPIRELRQKYNIST